MPISYVCVLILVGQIEAIRTPHLPGAMRDTGGSILAHCKLKRKHAVFCGCRKATRLGEGPCALCPPEALDEFDCFLTGVNLQLAVEVAHVGAHGVVAHVELAGDTAEER